MWLLFAAAKANVCVEESLFACNISGYDERSLAMKIGKDV
jgi:hypothetical protein